MSIREGRDQASTRHTEQTKARVRDVSYDWTHWSGQLTMVWREAVRRLAVTRLRKADPVISQSQINKLYTCAAADQAWRPGKYFCFSMKIIQLTSGTTLSTREEREALVPGPVIAVQCTVLALPLYCAVQTVQTVCRA